MYLIATSKKVLLLETVFCTYHSSSCSLMRVEHFDWFVLLYGTYMKNAQTVVLDTTETLTLHHNLLHKIFKSHLQNFLMEI